MGSKEKYVDGGWCEFSSRETWMNIIGYNSKYANFRSPMEDRHAAPHVCIGGSMQAYNSPDDPFFFLHHNFIDLTWEFWLNCHGYADGLVATNTNKLYPLSGRDDVLIGLSTETTVSDVFDIEAMGYTFEQGTFFSDPEDEDWNPWEDHNCIGDINLDRFPEQIATTR